MNKTAEINYLHRVIQNFGPNSYLGPWLAENRASIIADITNDVTPTAPMPAEARAIGSDIIVAAQNEAARIVEAARKQAAELMMDAQERRQHIRRDLFSLARLAEKAAEGL